MINYTLTIPSNKKVSKNNSNGVGSVDYKSIALPTELQGHEAFFNSIYYIIKKLFLLIYMMKNYCCTIGYIQTLNVSVNIYLD